MGKGDKGTYKFMHGYRPVVRAREGRMLSIRQPLDGPVFDILEDAENWCMYAMTDHYDRKLGMAAPQTLKCPEGQVQAQHNQLVVVRKSSGRIVHLRLQPHRNLLPMCGGAVRSDHGTGDRRQ